MDISNFDFNLPKSLIASRPLKPRSSAKLLLYEQSSIKDLLFFNLPNILSKNDLLVLCDTYLSSGNKTTGNHRFLCNSRMKKMINKPWFGFKQQYFIIS